MSNRASGLAITVIGILLTGSVTCAHAQWLNYPDKRIPFTLKTGLTLIPDSDLLEYVCTENEKDRVHLK